MLDNELCCISLYLWALLILQTFRHFIHVTTHSPTLPSLYLRHSSFSNPSVASSTSQFILQPFFRFSYVISSSFNSSGEPPMAECHHVVICKIGKKNEFPMAKLSKLRNSKLLVKLNILYSRITKNCGWERIFNFRFELPTWKTFFNTYIHIRKFSFIYQCYLTTEMDNKRGCTFGTRIRIFEEIMKILKCTLHLFSLRSIN